MTTTKPLDPYAPNYLRRGLKACFRFGLKPRDEQPQPVPKEWLKTRRRKRGESVEERNARIIDSGYQAYAREEGHYDNE